jgi:hypothetical protein
MFEKLIEIAFSGFWHFIGAMIILTLILKSILIAITSFTRMAMIRKHGWPPAHLDADGDLVNKSTEDSKN